MSSKTPILALDADASPLTKFFARKDLKSEKVEWMEDRLWPAKQFFIWNGFIVDKHNIRVRTKATAVSKLDREGLTHP